MLRTYIVTALLFYVAIPRVVVAEEPIEPYIAALQERGYVDVALRYLDRMRASDLAPESFKQEIDYRRGMLLVDSARSSRNAALRQEILDDAEQALQRFVSAYPQHPSAALAQSQLGNVLVERARSMMSRAEGDEANRASLTSQAANIYAKAYDALVKSRHEIGEQYKSLVAMRDPESRQRLSAVKTQYVQTYLAIARVLFEQAETVATDEEAYRAKLTEAATAFEEVAQKYRLYGAGVYALLYEGQCYQLLGEHKRALTYFAELLQNTDNSAGVRRLKCRALAKSIESWLATDKSAGPDRSIALAKQWLTTTRGDEDKDPAWSELKLSLAQAYQQKSSIAETKVAADRALSEARKLAGDLARRRGPVQEKAQQLLVTLGRAPQETATATVDLETAANFDEARDAAKQTLDGMKLAQAAVSILSSQLDKVNDAARRAEIEKKLLESKSQLAEMSQKALSLFERAAELATADDTEELNSVRYYLAYLYYKAERYRYAAVLAGFVATHYPDSLAARECANVALAARQRLYQSASPDQRDVQSKQIARLAELMISKWPGQPQAESALSTLLDLAVQKGDIEQAEAYLNRIPADSRRRAAAELRTGQAVWREYLKSVQAEQSGESKSDLSQLSRLKQQAQQMLAQGLGRIGSSKPTESVIRSALSLAQIYVDSGQPEDALALLKHDGYGAISLGAAQSPWVQRIPGLAVEGYRTAIRAHVAEAAQSSTAQRSIDAAQDLLDELRSQLSSETDGQQKMISIYAGLARDLERQLTVASPQARLALSKGYESFLKNAARGSEDISVLNWAAETLYSLGQGMLQGNQSSPEAQRYFTEASDAFARVLTLAKSHPGKLSADELTQVKVRQAMCLRQLGKYRQSVELFTEILAKRNKVLNVQVEAARTLQRWGDSGNAEGYWLAIQGTKPGADGRNVIWGWGRIANIVSKNTSYRDTFHLARYYIAHCRFKYALSTSGERQKELLGRAKADILVTQKLYDLGGSQRQQQYESLLKQIQRSLGEDAVGFSG